MRTHTVFIIAIIAASSLGAFAQAPPPAGAKEAFYDPQQPPQHGTPEVSEKKHEKLRPSPNSPIYDSTGRRIARSSPGVEWTAIGLSYWIELEDASGSSRNVTDQQTFKSGDRIRLHFRANANGRVQIMQLGASGRASVLFPDATRGASDNLLHANDERILPASTTWFKFDRNAGTETLFVMFAKTQEELDRVAPMQVSLDARVQPLAPPEHLSASAGGRKDLMIEIETEHAAEIGTYAVSSTGKPIVLQIVLKHR
jgi:hypothetical protein